MLDLAEPKIDLAQREGATALSLRGLVKRYGNGPIILNGISLTVRPGERVALIGSNGSGKSTLLRCLIGLHEASAGEVITLGEDISSGARRAQLHTLRRQTGFVFQKHCLVRRRSVLSNVIHGMMGTKGSWRAFSHVTAPAAWREKALQALGDVGLSARAMERADALSGGQQQRVAIARALVRGPRLLIADEPAASLDPVAGREVMALFARLAADHGITLLFTSHDMTHAMEFADRVVALKNGRVFCDLPADRVTKGDLRDVFQA